MADMVYFPHTANTGTILTMHIYTQSKDLISATSIHKINLIANLHLSNNNNNNNNFKMRKMIL